MTEKSLSFTAVLAVCVILMAGCAGVPGITKLVDVKKFADPPQKRLGKVLVVGKPLNENNRIGFESYFSQKLLKRKTDAVPSHELIPEMDRVNRESLREAVLKIHAETVLVTRVVGVDEKMVRVDPQVKIRMDPSASPGMGMTMSPFIEPPKIKTLTHVRLETGLFDVNTENMVWFASSVIMDPSSANEAVKDFSQAIIDRLALDGYVK